MNHDNMNTDRFDTIPPASHTADTEPAPPGYEQAVHIPRPDCRDFADVDAWLRGS